MSIDLTAANAALSSKSAQEIVAWAVAHADGGAMVSTNFRPQEAVILHLCTQVQPDMPVLWVDTGYNTPATYQHAEAVIAQLGLHVRLFVPQRSAAHRDAVLGGIPDLSDEAAHQAFTEEVKLEPFRRGLAALEPTVWFTALRREQTEFRAGLQIVGQDPGGPVKVCPLLDWTEADLEGYLREHGLPNETDYFDPTKVLEQRECGLHPDFFSEPQPG